MVNWITQLFKNYFKHEGLFLASHISFCAILSLIPLMLIAIAITGSLLGASNDVYQEILQAIANLLPQSKDFLTPNLKQVVGKSHSFGLAGFFLLVFIATLLFGAIERGLDRIFEAEKSRNFFHSRFLAILLMVIISLFFFLPSMADFLTRTLTRYGFEFPLGAILRGPLFYFLFSFFAFVLVVMVIPSHRIRFFPAILGGLFFAVTIFVAKQIFRWYMFRAFAQYSLIYGSLTALILLVLWIYYVSNLLLFSAEIVASLIPSKR